MQNIYCICFILSKALEQRQGQYCNLLQYICCKYRDKPHPHSSRQYPPQPCSYPILCRAAVPGEAGTRFASSVSRLVQSLSQTMSSATYAFLKISSLHTGIFLAHACYGASSCPPVTLRLTAITSLHPCSHCSILPSPRMDLTLLQEALSFLS